MPAMLDFDLRSLWSPNLQALPTYFVLLGHSGSVLHLRTEPLRRLAHPNAKAGQNSAEALHRPVENMKRLVNSC